MTLFWKMTSMAAAGAIALAAFGSATGSAVAADFSGKTIEWIIPFSEGGSSDKWAR